jgi:flagellar biosynthesis/type III secretory pathway protein FliH
VRRVECVEHHSHGSHGAHGAAAPGTPSPADAPPVHQDDCSRCVFKQQAQAVAVLADNFAKQAREVRRAADHVATELALAIAAKLLDREVSNAAATKALIAQALTQISSRERLTIRLNPADAELLREARGKPLTERAVLPEDATLVADPSLKRGGCIIESSAGSLDARIETQLALVARALRGTEQEAEHAGR